MNYCKYFLVLSTSFCAFSLGYGQRHRGLLGLTHGHRQHQVDLSAVTSALTGGLQKVLGAISNPKPITIEVYSQEQPQYDDRNPYGQAPDAYMKPYGHRYQHHHHHHHGRRPPGMYPEGQGYPFGGMNNYYPYYDQQYGGMDGQNQNYYPGGEGQNGYEQFSGMDGQKGSDDTGAGMNEYGGNEREPQISKLPEKQDGESDIQGYIGDFPVILLNENEIR